MATLEKWLKERSLVISLLLALAVSYGIGTNGVVSENIMPFSDGEHYVLRGLTLYGYLHSGQWAQFWDVFTMPRQSLAPLHYWIFFLLPQSWASMTSYGVVQAVTTYVLLALGAWALCRALDRVAWAPALFLLCASQNISLDESYFYHVDASFLAMGTVALAWQVRAWRDDNWRNSLLSGVGAGLMFWVKPANAVIFMATYLLAEMVRVALIRFAARKNAGKETVAWSKNLGRHVAGLAAGFLPVTFLAMACGGVQSIAKLINANEASGILATMLECTGFFRLFYFPLCLTIFYHTIALLLIFATMGLVAFKMNHGLGASKPPPAPDAPFPAFRLLPLVAAYLALGLFFSFGMADKEMRSLLLVLPVFWLAFFWALEHWRVRPGLVFLAAVTYAICAFSQILFDTFETLDVATESYQLKGDWLSRLPQVHSNGPNGLSVTNNLLGVIQKALPDGGKIAVGSEQLFLTSESLNWAARHDPALHGQQSPYEFENFLTVDGKYARSALLNARGILVYVHPSVQYSPDVFAASKALVKFSSGDWTKTGLAQMNAIQNSNNEVMGYLVVMKEPLTDTQIDQLMAGTHATALSPAADTTFNWPDNHRLTWRECEDILLRWKQKRLGEAVP